MKKLKSDKNEQAGHYLGTEIDEKWWKRYTKDKLFARGNGHYWMNDEAFFFRRYLTRQPIAIPWAKIKAVKLGKWHAGRWCFGLPIVKIIWAKNSILLSSGFLFSKDKETVFESIELLKEMIEKNDTV